MSVFSGRTGSSTPSSSILKTSSLKKQLNQKLQTPSKVRFVLPHSKKVKVILEDFKSKQNVKEFETLVYQISSSEFADNDISLLLKESVECISLMNQDLRLFVEAVLSISWIDKCTSVVKEYQSFIVNLISAHNYHAEFVIDKLVSLLHPNPNDPEWPLGTPDSVDIKKCSNIHYLLKILLNIVPLCKELLIKSLVNHFPYMKKSTHIHEYYLHNLLWVIQYEPSIRPEILHLIFSKLVIIDVNAPREEIEKLSEDQPDEIFCMEDDGKSVMNDRETILPIANTLDVCLDKIFTYLDKECHNNDSKQLNWDKTKRLYQDIMAVFDKIILPTYNTHHVQFVIFVLSTFRTTISEGYLNFLWRKVSNPNVATVLRQAAVNYMVSFLARASFLPMTMLKATLQQMTDWIHSYATNQEELEVVNVDVKAHTVFYSVCQALFYVIAFRHDDFVNSRKNITFLEGLNLTQIVTGRLNPLRVCQPAVVHNFAHITKKYQLAYCYTIIEQNSRNTLPTIYRDEKGAVTVSNSILEAFYPFDPYLLPRSGEKVYPYYRDYVESSDTELMEVCDGNDDFLEHQDQTQKFSYGTSPGFKFKM